MMWSFDVFTAHHDDIKTGTFTKTRSRVLVSMDAFPSSAMAADVAACMAVAIHGGMATDVMPRY